MMGLTKRMRDCLEFLRACEARGQMPTTVEICDGIGEASRTGVLRLLDALEEREFIKRIRGDAGWMIPRGIVLIEQQPVPVSA